MRVTVCQLRNQKQELIEDWEKLRAHVQAERSEFLVVPEMAFSPWVAVSSKFVQSDWDQAVEEHERWIERLGELNVPTVMGSRPVTDQGRRFNETFIWQKGRGLTGAHRKYYVPNEFPVWEASWYQRGEGKFQMIKGPGSTNIGSLICSDLWFLERARRYGRDGAHFLVNPRKTDKTTLERWIAAGKVSAIVSGAFCLSSNSYSSDCDESNFGGMSWIISPTGIVLGTTNIEKPFLTLDLDPRQAEQAKSQYPNNVPE